MGFIKIAQILVDTKNKFLQVVPACAVIAILRTTDFSVLHSLYALGEI
jgi:hypothetical protein